MVKINEGTFFETEIVIFFIIRILNEKLN